MMRESKHGLGYDEFKCLRSSCGFCPAKLLDDNERIDAAFAVADVLMDPVAPLQLSSANVREVVDMAAEVVARHGIEDLMIPVSGALALKASGLCD